AASTPNAGTAPSLQSSAAANDNAAPMRHGHTHPRAPRSCIHIAANANRAHHTSVRPAIHATDSTCTGMIANHTDAIQAAATPTPTSTRSSANRAVAAACESRFTTWNQPGCQCDSQPPTQYESVMSERHNPEVPPAEDQKSANSSLSK